MSVESLQHSIFFIETSAFMEYILRADANVCSLYNVMITDFIGFLSSKKIKTVTSETAKKETEGQIIGAVNRMLDEINIRQKWQIRENLLAKAYKRYRQPWSRVEVLPLHGKTEDVKIFYQELLKDLVTRAKLRMISKFKHRKRPIPEDSDFKILSEAISLKTAENDLFFVTKDQDFCEFSKEIKNKFDIVILPVQDLFRFKSEVLNGKIGY